MSTSETKRKRTQENETQKIEPKRRIELNECESTGQEKNEFSNSSSVVKLRSVNDLENVPTQSTINE